MTVLDEPRTTTATVRPRRRSGWLMAGGVLALATVGWFALQTVALLAHRTTTDRREFPAAAVRSVEVTTDGGDVRLVGGSGDRITVTATIEEGLRSPRNSQRITDGVLSVSSDCPTWSIAWCDVSYVIELPSDVAVRVRTDSGDVSQSRLTNTVTISTDTGNVNATAAGAGAISITSDTGDVDLTFDASPTTLTVSTDTGDIDVVLPPDGRAYLLSAESDTGDIATKVTTDPASAYPIKLVSDDGDISVRYASP